jgi:hypothetical protein
MAQAQTREELLLMTFCSALQSPLGGQGAEPELDVEVQGISPPRHHQRLPPPPPPP